MVFSLKSSAYLRFSPPFLLLFISKQFQTFLLPFSPTRVNPVASVPHFSPPSFPSPFLSSPFSDSQIFTADSCTCTAWGRGHCLLFLHSAVNHIISANQKRAVCVSQGIPANMSPGGGKFVEKKIWERECVCHVCVCFGTRPAHYVLFLNPTVGWQKTPFSERIGYISKP